MTAYITKRLITALPVLLVVGIFVFLLMRLAPGDPAAVIAGPEASNEDVARIRESLGLDLPIPAQFGIWMGHMLTGDFGKSYRSKQSVLTLIARRIEPTLAISVLAQGLTLALALPLGVLAAWKAGTWIDRIVMIFSVLGFSMPIFWLGFILMTVFGIWAFGLDNSLLPVSGYQRFAEGSFWGFLKHLILPAVSMSLVMTAIVARMTRSSVIETLNEDYIRTARAKGLAERVVLLRHAIRNASLPIMTVIGLQFAALLAGAVVVESTFAVPGVGRLLVEAISFRDFPVIQGVLILAAASYAAINLLIDISYAYFDPRIRY